MHKRDVLFLCQFFYPEYNSSATLPFDTAKHLVSKGLVVDALCGYPKEYSQKKQVPLREEKDGVHIRRVRYVQLKRGKAISRLINYFSFTASVLLRIGMFRKYKSVIVYSNPPVLPIIPILANKLFKTKFVFVAYDIYPEVAYASDSVKPGGSIDRVMKWINHRLYKSASCVVALTDEMKTFLLEQRPELSEDRVVTIANWAHEKEHAADEDAYQRFGYQNSQFIVSYFGNMGTCQDMNTLMDAARQLKECPNIQFLIVGHGNKKESIKKMIMEENLQNVQLLDFLVGKEFEQAVSISSCCVVSLEKGLKGTCAPSKYYSYLQGGKPVLAVVEKGSYLAEEVNDKKIGQAVEIGCGNDLKYAILAMAQDRIECTAMGCRAKELYMQEYDIEIGCEKYFDMIKKIL